MATNWVPIAEGELVDGNNLTAKFDDLEVELNALEETSVMPYALHREHLNTTIVAAQRAALGGTTNHTYDSTSEPYPGYGLATSWKVINANGSIGTGTPLSVTFSPGVDMSANAIVGGIVVLANVHLITITAATTLTRRYAAAFFAIQYRVSGNWYTLARTERYVSPDINYNSSGQLAIFKDVPIRTLILPADVTGKGNEIVTDVRMVVSVERGTAAIGPVQVNLRQGALTAFAPRAGSL